MTDPDPDTTAIKDQLQAHYREETGHELPDHVVDNLDVLRPPNTIDTAELEQQRRVEVTPVEDGKPTPQQYLLFIADVALSGFIGLQVSRFFTGTLAQVAGGVLVGAFVFAVITFVLMSGGNEGVDR